MRLSTRRLLTAVKSGYVLGAELETRLADVSVQSGILEALSMRSETRSLASNPLAITAFIASPIASNLIFASANSSNSTAVQALVANASSMNSVSSSIEALNVIYSNQVSWSLFIASPYFIANSKNIIGLFAGINPSLYPTVEAMVLDDVSIALIANNVKAFASMLQTPSAITALSSDSVAMSIVADNPSAITSLSESASNMAIIASSNTAMQSIVTRTIATGIMSNNRNAISAIYNEDTAWTSFKAGSFFATYLKSIVSNLAGLNPASYASINSIINSLSALTLVESNLGATQALSADPTAVTYLSTHPNFTVMAGNSTYITALSNSGTAFANFSTHANFTVASANTVTMSIFAASSSAMAVLVGNNAPLATMFASSAAKGAIFNSAIAVNSLIATPSAVTYLGTIQTLLLSSTTPTANNWVSFGSGLPSKILMVSYRQQGIGAIETPIRFRYPESAQLSMVGTAAIGNQIGRTHIGAYSNLEFNTTAISAITGAGIGYISMV